MGVTCLILECNMTHSWLRHDSFVSVTWLIHGCDMTPPWLWRDWFRIETWLLRCKEAIALCAVLCKGDVRERGGERKREREDERKRWSEGERMLIALRGVLCERDIKTQNQKRRTWARQFCSRPRFMKLWGHEISSRVTKQFGVEVLGMIDSFIRSNLRIYMYMYM